MVMFLLSRKVKSQQVKSQQVRSQVRSQQKPNKKHITCKILHVNTLALSLSYKIEKKK